MTWNSDGIVAGYDGSPGAAEALQWAVREARERIAARIKELDQILRWHVTRLADPGQASLIQHRERALRDSGGTSRSSRTGGDPAPLPALVCRCHWPP